MSYLPDLNRPVFGRLRRLTGAVNNWQKSCPSGIQLPPAPDKIHAQPNNHSPKPLARFPY
jgi:hypothetical protein